MKYFVLFAVIFFQFPATGQNINLQSIDGAATFTSQATVKGMPIGELHEKSIQWIKKTFLTEEVITLNAKTKIVANYTQDYSDGAETSSYKHDLQLDIEEGMVTFTISDKSIGLIKGDGSWKKQLDSMKVMLEESTNELFRSYVTDLNAPVK